MMRSRLFILLLALASAWSQAAEPYPITAQALSPDSWLVEADTGYFTPENGGFLVNTAFIATQDGVVIIGSGPSALFGQAYRRLIESTTGKPLHSVLITHKHPDHFLGSQAFSGVPVRSDAITSNSIREQGDGLAENLYRLVGDKMHGTEVVIPTPDLQPGRVNIGGHDLELIAVPGHTQSDIAVFDHSSGILYAIDQVFNQRTPTLPNADIAIWLQSLDKLARLPFKLLVPGHGPVSRDASPIHATRDYLQWLDRTLQDAASRGLAATEVMALPIPERFSRWSEARDEWRRSVGFLYSRYERAQLPWLDPG